MFKFIQTNFSSATVPQQIDKTRKSLNGKNCKLKLEGKKKVLNLFTIAELSVFIFGAAHNQQYRIFHSVSLRAGIKQGQLKKILHHDT